MVFVETRTVHSDQGKFFGKSRPDQDDHGEFLEKAVLIKMIMGSFWKSWPDQDDHGEFLEKAVLIKMIIGSFWKKPS